MSEELIDVALIALEECRTKKEKKEVLLQLVSGVIRERDIWKERAGRSWRIKES